MERANKRVAAKLSLTSLMDVFTILVLYLLVNQSSVEVVEPPHNIKLPDSVAQVKPHQSVVVMVSDQDVMVEGKAVMSFKDLLKSRKSTLEPVREALLDQKKNVIGANTEQVAASNEVTIMAQRTIPFRLLKLIMSSCASAGYTRISLAVIQRSSRT